jgi:para-nitrobenzyl esterase
MPGTLVVETEGGKVRGAAGSGVTVFNAIPYAAPPLGALRFAAPQPVVAWSGERDCTQRGASAPQGPSRLDAVMGVAPFVQSEDCLTLTVWTPDADAKRRPVLYFLHGGAYQSGGAHQVFYDGGNLARAGGIVVVGVNYRLGALGYLYMPEAEAAGGVAANRGLLDQMAALAWVKSNIDRFGGDPNAITIAGQSAGGGSVYALLANPAARAMVARAIPQSPSASTLSVERAMVINKRFYELAGVPQGDIARLKAMTIPNIIAAQRGVQMEIAAAGDRTIAYQNVSPSLSVPINPADAIARGAAANIPLLIGTTLDEGHAWIAQDDKLVAATDPSIISAAIAAEAAALPAVRRKPGQKPWELLSAVMTWSVFEKPAQRVASGHAAHGGQAYLYRFDWRPTPDARFGACHCIELPFMFDNLAGWPPSAMMAGHDPASYRALAGRMRDAWATFVLTGNPATPGLPEWPAWSGTRRAAMILDDTPHVVVAD